jgi:hypothetical protein
VVTCNQPTSNVTKINQLICTCNQSDIYMIKMSHLSNVCTNVINVSHFYYTCIINIGWTHSKKKQAYRSSSLSSFIFFLLLVHLQRFKTLQMHYLKLHKISLKCKNKKKCTKKLKLKTQVGLTCG